jgi:farnesyl diphosphate synthase
MTGTVDLNGRLDAVAQATEGALDALTATLPGVPDRLRAAMRHAVLGGGKRLRPFLVVETAALFGVPEVRALRTGVALECVHCYSLVHDDLPAMDDDDLRRGRPTVHVAYDEASAILVGDALLTLAFEAMADPEVDDDPAVRCRLVADLARAAGAAGMVGGQLLDLAAEGRFTPEGRPLALTIEDVLDLQALKTGALFRFAVEAGALIGRANHDEAHALGLYARLLGRAFQIADDLLDAEGDPAKVGKATGKDAALGKATLVGLLGVAEARRRLAATAAEAQAALAPLGARGAMLAAAIAYVAARDV